MVPLLPAGFAPIPTEKQFDSYREFLYTLINDIKRIRAGEAATFRR